MEHVLSTPLVLDPLPVLVASACLVLLMGHAGVSKLRDRSLFEQHLAAYRVPNALLAPLGWALPLLECVCALLLLGPWRAAGAALCALLLLLYALAMVRPLRAGSRLDCGCGGEPLALSWALVWRNLALLPVAALAGAAALVRPLGWADAAVAVAAVLLGLLLWAVLHQVLRHRQRAASLS